MAKKPAAVPFLGAILPFHHAANLLTTTASKGVLSGNLADASLAIPSIVMHAFACELFLKALKQQLEIHELDTLYNNLKITTKEAIRRKTGSFYGQPLDEPAFSSKVSEIAKLFIDWRYFYATSKSADYRFIQAFHKALYEFAIDNHLESIACPDF